MSYKVLARDCETLQELQEWARGHIPTAVVQELHGEIVISTGLGVGAHGGLFGITQPRGK